MAGGGERRALFEALRNLSVKALSLGFERVCRLAVVILSARVLGQAAFGRFVFASTATALLALGTDLGLGVWTTRSLARRGGDDDRVIRFGLLARATAAVPYGLAVAALAAWAEPGEARWAIVFLGIAALLNAFVDHVSAVLRGHERFTREARLNSVRAVLTLALGFSGLALGRTLAAVCVGLAAAAVGSLLYGAAALGSAHPGALRARRSGPAIDGALVRGALRESLPIWVAGLFSMLYFKVDTLLLGPIAGDAELGAYGAAYKFFEGAMILPAVLLAVTFPRLARAHGYPRAQRRLERRVTALLLAMGLCVGAVFLGAGRPLVHLVLGGSFERALPSLRVLACGVPLLFLNFGLTHFLVARDRGRATQWLSMAMLGINVTLNALLIPRAGGPGAACATVLTELALTAGCLAALRLAPAPVQALRPSAPEAPRTGQRAA
ncbi:MAG: flippase [Myxococcales bacterium]|nr:flippase [Myxococcales bacterium]